MPIAASARSVAWSILLAATVLALVPAGVSAAPAVGERARGVIERYVSATGGAAALAAERDVHVRGRLRSMALDGTFEQWSQIPDRLASDLRLGSVHKRTGFDGRVGWETDLASKQVRILDGKELEKLRSDVWFENEMWAREGHGGGTITYVSTVFRQGDLYHVLEITPPVGPSRRLMFSEKTGLLGRVVTRFDQHESASWLSEYRLLAGRRRPTVQAGVEPGGPAIGDDASLDHARLDSVWVNLTTDSARFAPPEASAIEVTWLKTPGIARIPFRYGSHHLWVKVSIDGAPPADFLVDTGASGIAIDRGYAEQIGLAREGRFAVQGMGGSDVGAFARVGSMRIVGSGDDGVSLAHLRASIVDLSRMNEEALWRRLDGLLGFEALERFVVEVDYDRELITLHDPATFVPERTGKTVPMRLLSGIPIVTARLDDGCEGDFLVDTGSSFGVLVHGSLVDRCRVFTRVGDRRQVKIYGGGVGSAFASWLCRLDTLRLGPFAVHEPIAGLSLARHGMVGSEHYAGNLGNGVLERFVCTFDYGRKTLHLSPGKRFDQRDRYSRVGAFFLRSEGRVTAVGIVRGSPADEAGLKSQDEILEIDGRPAAAFTPEEMDRIFVDGELGATHTLTVMQDGAARRVTVTLRDVI
jgi:aspartyl protease/PDZ domain-containing protein